MPEEAAKKSEETKEEEKLIPLDVDKPPVVTQHSLMIAGKKLDYIATAGMLPIKTDTGEVEAGIFYVAYSKKGVTDRSKRPLMATLSWR